MTYYCQGYLVPNTLERLEAQRSVTELGGSSRERGQQEDSITKAGSIHLTVTMGIKKLKSLTVA